MLKNPFRYAVTTKITGVIFLVVVAINTIVFFNLSHYLHTQAIKGKKSELVAESLILQESLSFLYRNNEHVELQRVITSFGNKNGLMLAILFDDQDNILAANEKMGTSTTSPLTSQITSAVLAKKSLINDSLTPTTWLSDNKQHIYATTPVNISPKNDEEIKKNGLLLLHFNVRTLNQNIDNAMLSAFLPIVFITLIGGLSLIYYFYLTVGKRIENLKALTSQFITDQNEDIEKFDDDEISALFQSFNQLSTWFTHVHEKLYDSREHLKSIQNSISEAIIATNASGEIINFNKAAEKMTGLTSNQVKHLHISNFIKFFNEQKQALVAEPFSSILTEEKDSEVFEALLATQQNEKITVSCSITPIYKNKKLDGIVAVLHDLTERQELLACADDSEKNYKSLFNLSRDGYVIHHGNGKIINPNPAFNKIIGYSTDELLSMSWADIVPKKWQFWEKMHQSNKLISRGYTDLYELEYLHKNGQAIFVEVQAFLLNNVNNIDEAVIGAFIRNITERKKQDENLSQYKQILSSSSDLITLLDKDLIIQTANYAFLKYFDLEFSQVIDHKISQVIGKNDFDAHLFENINKALKGETAPLKLWANFKMTGKRYMHVTCTPYFNEKSVITGVVINARDITIEKIQEEKVFAHQAQQELILNNMVDAVITIDSDGYIESFNNSAETLFGYKSTEIIGKNVKQLMPHKYNIEHDSYLKNYLNTNEKNIIGTGRDVTGLRKDGSEFPLRLSVAELPLGNNQQPKFIGTCHDLTLARKQEQNLLRHQKMDALGKLTGGIAHDFNNILGVILGYCELLELKLADTPKLVNYVKNISNAGNRGADLTRKLLSFSKKKHTNVDVVSINGLITSQQDIIEKSLTALVELHLDLAPNLCQANIDAGAFDDMILNMSINAAHAMPKGGDLYISTKNISMNAEQANTLSMKPGDYIQLSLRDTGIGMNEETREKIFEPFFTTKGDKGTGLGLSQVYGFVTSSSGYLMVNSTIGKGTHFTLYFPCSGINIKKNKPAKALTDLNFMKSVNSVLIVDDEELLAEFAKEILESFGLNVLTAASGAKALALIAQHDIDIVISDVVMPKMNGYQLADEIMKKKPTINVLLASGYQGSLAQENEGRTVPLPLITKPYDSTTLLEGIKSCLST